MRNHYFSRKTLGAVSYVTASMKTPLTLNVTEAITHFGVSRSTIYRRIRAGLIVASKNERGQWVITTGQTVNTELDRLAAQMRREFEARRELAYAA